jgi:hypothetical protein
MNRQTLFFLPFLFLGAFLACGCGTLQMKSSWLDRDPTLGGDIKDWPGGMNALGDSVSIGASNNGDFLCLALAVRDADNGEYVTCYTRELAARGLTVWMDPQGGDGKSFGILLQGMEKEDSENPALETRETARSSDLAANGLEIILGNGKVFQTDAQALRVFGFEAKTSYSGGTFIFFMKLPLKQKEHSPFPLSLADSKAVGFGFEGKEFKVHKPGAGGGGGSGNTTDKFNVWLSLLMASDQRTGSK